MKLEELHEGVVGNVINKVKELLRSREEKKTGAHLLKNKHNVFHEYARWTLAEIEDDVPDERIPEAKTMLNQIKELFKKGDPKKLGKAVLELDEFIDETSGRRVGM